MESHQPVDFIWNFNGVEISIFKGSPMKKHSKSMQFILLGTVYQSIINLQVNMFHFIYIILELTDLYIFPLL